MRPKQEKHNVIISLSVPEEVRSYLRTLPNYSAYICELIENDRLAANDLEQINVTKSDKEQLAAILGRLFK